MTSSDSPSPKNSTWPAWWLLAVLFSPVALTEASLVGVINVENQIVLVGEGSQVLALDFTSSAGMLVPLPTADGLPFELLIANTTENVALGTLGPAVVIDGQLNTGVGYTGEDLTSDLVAIWANAEDEIASLPMSFEFPAITPRLTGVINHDNQLVLVGEDLRVIGIELNSQEALLVPLPPGDLTADATPFELVLANDATGITLGNLGVGIGIDGELLTPIHYLGSSPETDLEAFWGVEGSSDQVVFSITREPCGSDLVADIDRDGEVGFSDFLILSANFGQAGTLGMGDLDCSGDVNFPDFLILSRDFGMSLPNDVTSVPEPNVTHWLFVACVGLLRILQHARDRLHPQRRWLG